MRSLSQLEDFFIDRMRKYSISLLRLSLSIVFVWFGILKILNLSPVADLIKSTYPLYPEPIFIYILGFWEIAIGVGLLFKPFLRLAIILMWMQMAGIFSGFFISSALYYAQGNPLLLTTYGEFVVKNIVLIAASLVIVGYEIKHKKIRY